VLLICWNKLKSRTCNYKHNCKTFYFYFSIKTSFLINKNIFFVFFLFFKVFYLKHFVAYMQNPYILSCYILIFSRKCLIFRASLFFILCVITLSCHRQLVNWSYTTDVEHVFIGYFKIFLLKYKKTCFYVFIPKSMFLQL